MERPTLEGMATIPLFKRVTPADLSQLAAVSFLSHYDRGKPIFEEGDPSDYFYIVVSGRAKVFKRAPNGQLRILELFGPGGLLGAVAAYELRPYPAAAAAMEQTTCLLLPRPEFFALLEARPTLVRGLLGSLSIRLMELTARLSELTGGRVESRFARLFLKLAEQMGKPDRGGLFVPMVLSRQELADLTGTTVETCIRIMSRWSKDQILQTDKDGFIILDRPVLGALAEQSY